MLKLPIEVLAELFSEIEELLIDISVGFSYTLETVITTGFS